MHHVHFEMDPHRNRSTISLYFSKKLKKYTIDWRGVSLNLVMVSRSEIKKQFTDEPQRSYWTRASHPTRVQLSDNWVIMWRFAQLFQQNVVNRLAWFLVHHGRALFPHAVKLWKTGAFFARPLTFKRWFLLGVFQLPSEFSMGFYSRSSLQPNYGWILFGPW